MKEDINNNMGAVLGRPPCPMTSTTASHPTPPIRPPSTTIFTALEMAMVVVVRLGGGHQVVEARVVVAQQAIIRRVIIQRFPPYQQRANPCVLQVHLVVEHSLMGMA
eukprot:TRINITY_DN6084_c0_g1_i2.p4 TRINITY_DN6084_c0_g1~~TRINITY_DN6084_c0_g1_i2.p4  ORF type:complete len:107 (-),score=3.55 TRINITY_DN6084_c0_g1_i2:1319-1639(-)